MTKISVERLLQKSKYCLKKGEVESARKIYETILKSFPNNKKARLGLAALEKTKKLKGLHGSPQVAIKQLAGLFEKGNFKEVLVNAEDLSKQYPNNFVVWSFIGGAYQELGRFEDAIVAFTRVLEINPLNAEGHNNLGTVFQRINKIEEAMQCYKKALRIKPNYPQAEYNVGTAFGRQGKIKCAIEAYQRSLVLDPLGWEAYRNIGLLFKEKGDLVTAEHFFVKGLAIKPNDQTLLFNIGDSFLQTGKFDTAADMFAKLTVLDPTNPEYFSNMGVALRAQHKPIEAIDAHRRAILLKPDYPEAYNNLGNAFRDLRQNDDAIVAFNRALSLKPDYADAYINLGNSLKDLFKFSAAIKSYRKAIDLQPDLAAAYSNMGLALKEQGQSEKAIQAYKKAITIDPDYVDAYYNLSFALLGSRDFKQGFELQEWRWKTSEKRGQFLQSSKPFWGGEKNKTVYVWGEQGIGDEIMFASMLPELYEECANLIVKCDSRLIPIFQRSFPSKIEYYGRDAAVLEDSYDFHIPMGSLCSKYRTSLESFKNASAGFLKNDVERTKTLKNKIQAGSTKKVIGISWKTRSPLLGSITRNIELVDLVQTLDSPNTQLVCLQYGDVDDELEALRKDFGIDIMQVSEVDNLQNIDGLASLIMACDEVVSTTNATVHLAGALGANVKVLLPYSSRWIWGEGSDSFWYETAVPYAQNTWGSWENVLRAIAEK